MTLLQTIKIENRIRIKVAILNAALYNDVMGLHVICTKALPLMRFTVVNISHNIISTYNLFKAPTCQMFIFIL